MTQFFAELFTTEGFHPHGYCYLWRPGLVWLHVISDSLIGLAYIGIGMTLAYFVRRGSGDIPFSRIFVAFGVFIAACGATHFMEIWTLWNPVYWLAGSVKVVTAAASVLTAMVLPPLVPVALGTIRSARLSERRREELEEVNTRLTSTHEELNVLYARLKEADEAKTQFFANVSHELRTPLTLILGPTEKLLASGELTSSDRGQLDTVRRNAALLLKHVNDLLDVQKVGAGGMPIHYSQTDLVRTVRLCAAHFDSVAAERGIEFVIESPDSARVEADPEKISRVVLNLLGNAFKFTPDGGRIRCVVRSDLDSETGAGEEDRRVIIEVHDSGPGIPLHQRDAVFEPFRQGDDGPARRHGGTGLGLAIVRDFVRLHGGNVSIGDSPEGGALLLVGLPARAPAGAVVHEERPTVADRPLEPHIARPSDQSMDPAESSAGEEDQTRPLVLIAEDSPEMNRFIADSLAPQYSVATALDGRTAVAMARELRPDLILSDIMMPEMSGDELVRELRADRSMDSIPILLLSARADDELRIRLLREGAQDYLTKPFAVEELLARLGNWITMSRARSILQRELDSTLGDVEALAGDVAARKRDLESALSATQLALAEAEEANRSKADFLGVMSHELRTPLNAISGYVDLLELEVAGPLTDGQRRQLSRVKSSSGHLLQLIEEILTYARAQAGHEQLEVEEVDLALLVRETAALLAPSAAAKGLQLEVATPESPLRLRTDERKFRQILLNLGDNAIKFTESGSVSVLLDADSEGARLRVRDTGIGIAPEHRERIFEPFWQVDSSKTRLAEGTGLGLAITRKLADLLGGQIRVDSTPGTGTLFTVVLPSISESADPAEHGSA